MVAGKAGLGMLVNAGSTAVSAIGTGIGGLNDYMAERTSRMYAQNQAVNDYEDDIEDFYANALVQATYEQEMRDLRAEETMLRTREMLRRDYEYQSSIVPFVPPSGSSSSHYWPPLLQSPALHTPLPIGFDIGTPPRTSTSSSSFALTPELERMMSEGSRSPTSPMWAIEDVPPLPLGSEKICD